MNEPPHCAAYALPSHIHHTGDAGATTAATVKEEGERGRRDGRRKGSRRHSNRPGV